MERKRPITRTWKLPPLTSLKDTMAAPSSTSVRLVGGMLPGVIPPTSAWCPVANHRHCGVRQGKERSYSANAGLLFSSIGQICCQVAVILVLMHCPVIQRTRGRSDAPREAT